MSIESSLFSLFMQDTSPTCRPCTIYSEICTRPPCLGPKPCRNKINAQNAGLQRFSSTTVLLGMMNRAARGTSAILCPVSSGCAWTPCCTPGCSEQFCLRCQGRPAVEITKLVHIDINTGEVDLSQESRCASISHTATFINLSLPQPNFAKS